MGAASYWQVGSSELLVGREQRVIDLHPVEVVSQLVRLATYPSHQALVSGEMGAASYWQVGSSELLTFIQLKSCRSWFVSRRIPRIRRSLVVSREQRVIGR